MKIQKNGRCTAQLKEFKKNLTEINSIIDYMSTSSNNSSIRSSGVTSTTSSSNPRGYGVNVSSSSISSVDSYININDDDDDEENDFQDFFDSMADPEVTNLNKIQMFKNFYLFVIAKSNLNLKQYTLY